MKKLLEIKKDGSFVIKKLNLEQVFNRVDLCAPWELFNPTVEEVKTLLDAYGFVMYRDGELRGTFEGLDFNLYEILPYVQMLMHFNSMEYSRASEFLQSISETSDSPV